MREDFAANLVSGLLEARTGQQLTRDRHWRIETALAGLMREQGIENADQLARRLLQPGQEALAEAVVEALLNNETYFFRDRPLFDQLSQKILPALAARRGDTRRLAIWSAGCSTGQEALSLAMIFAEQRMRWAGWTIEIVATDVSRSAIASARKGAYSQFQVQRGLGVQQMLTCFEEAREGWRVDPALHRAVRFEVHNVLDPAPRPGRFDLVLCRNVLLYFDSTTRGRALDRIGDALADDGFLMLGGGESPAAHSNRFVTCRANTNFFQHAPSRAATAPGKDAIPIRPSLSANSLKSNLSTFR